MEIPFETVRIEGVNFECAQENHESYVTVASICKALNIEPNTVHNIIQRVEPYKSLCKDFEKCDSRGRRKMQKCVPLACLSGLIEKIKSSKAVRGHAEIKEKADFMLTLFNALFQKLIADYIKMSDDLLSIMEAQNTQREVFSERANLSSKMRQSKKLIDGYYKKYEHKLSGQLELE